MILSRTSAPKNDKSYLLLMITFLAAIGIGSAILGSIYFIREEYHASYGEIGLFSSIYFLSYFLGCFFMRPLGRKIFPRLSIIIATALMTLFLTLILLFPYFPLIFILFSLYGFSISLFFPPVAGWMSSGIEGIVLNKAISRWNLSWSTGGILSPVITGFLTEKDARYPLFLSIAIFFTCFLIISAASIFSSQIRSDNYLDSKPEIGQSLKDTSTSLRFPSRFLAFTVYIAFGIIMNIFPVYGSEKMGISESRIGILFLVRALFTTVSFYILGKTTYWHFKSSIIIATQILFVVLLSVLIFVQSYLGYLLIMPFLGIIIAISYSLSLFHGTSGSLDRSNRTAIHELVLSSGVMVGSIVGGLIFEHYSMIWVYLFCILVAGVAVILQLFFRRKFYVQFSDS